MGFEGFETVGLNTEDPSEEYQLEDINAKEAFLLLIHYPGVKFS